MVKKGWGITAAGLLLLAAALVLLGHDLRQDRLAGEQAAAVLEELKPMIPPPAPALSVKTEDTSSVPETPAEIQAETQREPELSEGTEDETMTESDISDFVPDSTADMPLQSLYGVRYVGVLQIPSLNKELPIINDWGYDHLNISPCRYHGSAYRDDMIICGHNYDHHFGAIKRLHGGDAIGFTDLAGNTLWYEVTDVKILNPHAIDEILSGDWDLTLFTCTKGGATRVTVRCVRVADTKAPATGELAP